YRVDTHRTDTLAVELHFRVDVDVAHVRIQEPVLIQLNIDTDLRCKTPGVVKIKVTQTAFRAEECGVVQPHTHIRLHAGLRQEMPLEAQRGRQVFGGPDVAQAYRVNIVLERKGAKQLDTHVWRSHVGHAKTGSGAVSDVDTYRAVQHIAVVGLGFHVSDTDFHEPVAGFMSGYRTRRHQTHCHNRRHGGLAQIRTHSSSPVLRNIKT